MSDLSKEPGYLGLTNRGVIAIHADWPAYAVAHGSTYSLLTLGQFPIGTRFTKLDEIDACVLFLVQVKPTSKDPYDKSQLHVALWREDLGDLIDAGHVAGGARISNHEWVSQWKAKYEGAYYEDSKGNKHFIDVPDAEDLDDMGVRHIQVEERGLSLQPDGLAALNKILAVEKSCIEEEIMRRARPSLLAKHYDTAIREACLVLETKMRATTKGSSYGCALVEEFFAVALSDDNLVTSQLKTLRVEAIAFFKYVRNEYAHNLHDIDATQCYALLVRTSMVLSAIEQVRAHLSRHR